MLKYFLIPLLLAGSFFQLWAQDTTSNASKPTISYVGFVEAYYAFDFNKPTTNYRQTFFYNHNRHNEFNVNLGLIQLKVEDKRYRGSLGIQIGNYAEDVYALESDVFKAVYEAYAGVSLDEKSELWIDAGIFISHLGFESPISSDNFTLTRSLLPESSPYYLSGAKITWTPNDKWLFSGVVSNGWQRIQRVQDNSMLGYGTQVCYDNNNGFLINWSTFVGTEDPDSTRRIRIFNDFYTIINLNKKMNLIAGLDIGFQQDSKGSGKYNQWVLPVLILQYKFNEKWATAFRAEYVNDKNNIVISSPNNNGFVTSAFSTNLDFKPVESISCRIEGRWLNSNDKLYIRETSLVQDNFFITASIAFKITGQK